MSGHPSMEVLSALVDQELGAADADSTLAHVRACEVCGSAFETHRTLKHAISRLETRAAVPEALRVRIEALRFVPGGAPSRSVRAWVLPVAAMAAAVALFVVIRPEVLRPGLVQELVADHRRYAPEAMPAEVASDDPDIVRRFFEGKLPFAPVVPSFEGAELIGGRLCRIEGRKVELLFYEKDGRRVSLYVSDGVDARSQCRHDGATALCARSAAGLTYIMIGDLGTRELQGMLDGPVANGPS